MHKKISITKKIIGMVIGLVFAICLIIGVVSANITRVIITDEIEVQLKTGAYSVSQTIGLCTTKEEMDTDIKKLHEYTDIDVTIFRDNVRVASTIKGAVDTKMDENIYEELQNGKNYFATDVNVNGEKYFGYYIPFFEEGTFTGAIFTGIPQSEANSVIINTSIKIIGCILGYGLILSTISFLIVKRITKSIKKLESTIETLVQNDLVAKQEKYQIEHDELESLCNKTVDFSNSLNHIMAKFKVVSTELEVISSELKESVGVTNDTCTQISDAIESVASGAVAQAEDTSNASQNINEMSYELSTIRLNASDLNDFANSMDIAKNDVMNTLEELLIVNKTMADDISSTSNQVNATSESVKQIEKAVNMISDITEQTKLLSLNASIESARAGEHGKGFAVVAEEIGKLANQSAESSNEINSILKILVKNYNIIIQQMQNTSNNMTTQNSKLFETRKVFKVLEDDINGAVKRISEINTMVEHLDTELSEMVDMITNLSAISEENSASTEQIRASVEELTSTINQVYEMSIEVNSSADILMQEVNVFNTSN